MFAQRGRVVAKFGGTSMGSADAMRAASVIGRSIKGEAIIIVSAVSGTTDALIALGRAAVANDHWRPAIARLMNRHKAIVVELELGLELLMFSEEIEKICQGISMLGELSPATLDRLQSFGERLSATIFAAQLRFDGARAQMVDAFRLVATDDQFGSADVDFQTTHVRIREALRPVIADRIIPVITGFIGQSQSGHYATLGRGGSDYTAAIVASAMDARELQIWTDVDGMFTADPRVMVGATTIPQLSYAEASELAYFGARVLHPKTIKPAIERGIPVRLLNTFNPTAQGTLITSETRLSIKAVTSKSGITVVTVCSLGMLGAHGFAAKVFDVFARHKVVVDVLSSSEVSVSVTVDCNPPLGLLDDLRGFALTQVEAGMTIVCLVGEGIRTRTDVLGRLFTAVDVPVRMVSQGASQRNITFVVDQSDARLVVESVFHTFFAR